MPLKPEIRKNIFNKLKVALKRQCPPMVCTKDGADGFEIIGNKPVPYGSSKKVVPGLYFASAVARKGMVSFYLFPLYYHEKEFAKLAPTAMKCLKEKPASILSKEEQVIDKELDAMLKKGVAMWKKSGYLKD